MRLGRCSVGLDIIYMAKQYSDSTEALRDRSANNSVSIDVGVELVREWLGWNWSEIKDGGEPGLRTLVQEILSLAHSHERPDR